MLRGFYTAASGMLAQQRKTEMLTNNMANANTPGFKADQSSMRAFPEMLLSRIDRVEIPTEKTLNLRQSPEIGTLNNGVYMQDANPSFIQGALESTDRKTDFALQDVNMPINEATGLPGSVFFTVEGTDGQPRYTRNGNFTVDAQGFLTAGNGQYVLDDQGNRIQLNSDQFDLSENGVISENGAEVGRLGIAFSANPERLSKQGNGLFLPENNQPLPSAYNNPNVRFTTQQGYIEGSNVDSGKTMTDMLTAYRAFEANQKILQAYDRSMDKAVNEVGRVNG